MKRRLPHWGDNMRHLLNRIELFHLRCSEKNLVAAYAAKRLVDKAAADLELKTWRYASRLIMES